MEPNFLVPSNTFPRTLRIQEHLIWAIDPWHSIIVISINIKFHLYFNSFAVEQCKLEPCLLEIVRIFLLSVNGFIYFPFNLGNSWTQPCWHVDVEETHVQCCKWFDLVYQCGSTIPTRGVLFNSVSNYWRCYCPYICDKFMEIPGGVFGYSKNVLHQRCFSRNLPHIYRISILKNAAGWLLPKFCE